MENYDNEERELEARLAEIRRKKKELEEGAITVTIKEFQPATGAIGVHLSKGRNDVVDALRSIPGRLYSETRKLNFFSEKYKETFEACLDKLPFVTYVVPGEILTQIEEYRNQPDFFFDLDAREANIVVKPSPKIKNKKYVGGIDTWTYHVTNNYYTFAIAELYKLPNILRDWFDGYGRNTHELSDRVKFILAQQLLRRKEIEEISMMEDCPEIESPFTGINPDTGNPYELTPDQRVAIRFDEAVDGKAIIAYDVGKGKTAIAIAIAERKNLRVLFVCKANLKTNIKREIKKFTGKDATVFAGIEPDSLSIDYLFTKKQQYNIIGMEVIGRDRVDEKGEAHLMPWVEVLNASGFDRVYYDEAHLLKNIDSKRSRAARHITIPKVDFYTGTPVVNRPKELYPMLNILDKDTFNQEATFINNFSDGKNGVRNLSSLQAILKMYMIRRVNTGIETKDIPHVIELSPTARALYNKALEGLYICLRKGKQSNITNILTEILRLKQIVAEDSIDDTVELAEELLDQSEHKVVIYSQFKDCHSLIASRLGRKAKVINGDIASDDLRYEIVDEFQKKDSDLKVIVTNIIEGLTLTEGHNVILNDLPWTPKDIIQFKGRCFGRTNDYHGGNAYLVTAENTIIQMIQELLAEKLRTINMIVDDIHKEQMMNSSIISELIDQLLRGGK